MVQTDIAAPLLSQGWALRKPCPTQLTELCVSGTRRLTDVHTISTCSRAWVDQEPGEAWSKLELTAFQLSILCNPDDKDLGNKKITAQTHRLK